MKKLYALLNTAITFAIIFSNYYSNTGAIGGATVGDISDKYNSLFTPAGYAFAIWGIIFLGLIIIGVYQILIAFKGYENSDSILQIGPWLSIANILNATWLWFWLHEEIGISVIIMSGILFSLIQIIIRLNMERWDAPLKVIGFVWWPICIYSGWIAVATVANISSYLASLGWQPFFTDVQWTIIMISIAGILNLFMIYSRNMREFAVVGIWALIAIAVRHSEEIVILKWTAIIWAGILILAVSIHAYQNRETSPMNTLMK